MRKSRADAEQTRRHIVETAAREFRANGIHATGLAPLMAKAGLTHGGFYKHFDSKEQLVNEACGMGLSAMVEAFKAAAGEQPGTEAFQAIIEKYLSTMHRDNTVGGCPLAGLGSELTRADEQTRATATQGFHDMVSVLAAQLKDRSTGAAQAEAMFALTAMVGAITLSRIIDDPEASAAILDNAKHHLTT